MDATVPRAAPVNGQQSTVNSQKPTVNSLHEKYIQGLLFGYVDQLYGLYDHWYDRPVGDADQYHGRDSACHQLFVGEYFSGDYLCPAVTGSALLDSAT